MSVPSVGLTSKDSKIFINLVVPGLTLACPKAAICLALSVYISIALPVPTKLKRVRSVAKTSSSAFFLV